MENPEQLREREFQEFKTRWGQFFDEQETRNLVSQIVDPTNSPDQALFRVSSSMKDEQKPQTRSWSTSIMSIFNYLQNRFLNSLETFTMPIGEIAFKEFEPRINIINTKHLVNLMNLIDVENVAKEGLEFNEYEIDESRIDRSKVLTLDKVGEIENLKRLLLSELEPQDRKYEIIEIYLGAIASQLERVYKLKAEQIAKLFDHKDRGEESAG